MPRPPSAMASPGASPFGSTSVPPAWRDARVQPARADAVEQRDRRHVERQLQGAARRHRALECEIEILRRVGAVAHRPVLDQRLRMGDAVLEGEAVDERLQRRAGRAQRVGHVDLAGAALVEIIRRRNARQHFAGGVVHGEDRDREIRSERLRPLARQVLQIFLQARVDGQPMDLELRHGRDGLIGGMRRQRRHRPPAGRNRVQFGKCDFVGGNPSGLGDAVEHAVARRPRRHEPSDPAGAAPAIAAARPAAPLPPAKASSAPCRNRRATPRGCLRDCRHRAQASDKAQAPRPCSGCARSRWRERSAEAWRRACVRSRGSSRRATCMVKVEPPEMTRPLPMNCNAARTIASGSTPQCLRKRRSS